MFEAYSEQKASLLEHLSQLLEKASAIDKDFKIDMTLVQQKLRTSIADIKADHFAAAFFGGYSDGKTTILSSLLHRLDLPIEPGPTTDQVNLYPYEDVAIVDTPGLFSDQLLHSERTRQYISQANVVIFTVDASNPVKESQHKEVKWLLDDLDKAEATIFVINKMDQVADLEDESEFRHYEQIKRNALLTTLRTITTLKVDPLIVCVSGDPYARGLYHWFSQPDVYARLSHIGSLTDALGRFIDAAKGQLVIKAGLSVIRDTLTRCTLELDKAIDGLNGQAEIQEAGLADIVDRLHLLHRDASRSYTEIRKDALNLRGTIVSALNGAPDVVGLREVILEHVGRGGLVINEKLNNIIRQHTEQLVDEQHRFAKQVEASLHYYEGITDDLVRMLSGLGGQLGQAILSQTTRATADTILRLRDLSGLPVKFKPWGAVKWATKLKSFGEFLVALPVLSEIVGGAAKVIGEIQFRGQQEALLTEVEALFTEFGSTFTESEFRSVYCPALEALEAAQKEQTEAMNMIRQHLIDLQKAKAELEGLGKKDLLNL